MRTKVWIGTSGWSYNHWEKVIYPDDIKPTERLQFYAHLFDTVEINTTFYHLPKTQTVKNWRAQVSPSFIFSVKASRFITHIKRLHECQESLQIFYQQVKHLGKKLGPILFQLPPSFSKNLQRLQEFFAYLDRKYQYVFEFRNDSWFDQETYDLLSKEKIALCITDLGGELSPLEVTSDLVYVRLHGPEQAYRGRYSQAALQEWCERAMEWKAENKTVHIYFDNDEKGYAVKDAIALKKMVQS